jgi:type II secretory pathway pseudopilin PulG
MASTGSAVRHSQGGFTVPELIVAIVLLVVGIVSAAVMLRPASFEFDELHSERRLKAAELSQALTRYYQDKNAWPEGLTTAAKPIGTEEGQVDLCQALVPEYIKDMAFDPLIGYKMDSAKEEFVADPCTADGIMYEAGFDVSISKDGKHATVTAIRVETYPEIKITR